MNNKNAPEVRPHMHGPVPFGWRHHEELPGMLEAVPEEQEALQKAYSFIEKGCTVTATARWLSYVCGRRVDQRSLRNFYQAQTKEKTSPGANQT